MRIGIFTDSYPPYINGVSTSIVMLQQALEKKGHQVYIVTVNNEGKIVYITINFTKSIKVTTAEDLAIKSLDKVGEKNLTYYDVQYILTYSGTEENTNFPVFGSKSASSLKVVW